MSGNVAIATEKSNLGRTILGLESPKAGQIQFAINAALRKKTETNLWPYLAVLLRLTQRGLGDKVAKNRAAGLREYSLEDIALLLRSDVGLEVLKTMMGDKKTWPKWFKVCTTQIRMAKDRTVIRQLTLDYARKESEVTDEAAALIGGE